MIKRIRFATRRGTVSESAFAAAWPLAAGGAAASPPDVRPLRVAVCTTVPDVTGADPKHDGIGLEWFADMGHVQRYVTWLTTSDGLTLTQRLDEVVEADASPLLLAEEHVMRGADWLQHRWRDGGEKLKHMAIALRASELTPEEFSQRWRSRAGQIARPGSAELTAIPDDARGRAYVQNHPLPRAAGDWAYDALNEVYFDDVESLRTRIDWFRANLLDRPEEGLVREFWFLAAREVPCSF
jgi:hypothetical protein